MQKIRYIILFVAFIILIVQGLSMDYSEIWTLKNILPLLAPILIILSMILSINYSKKHAEN